ncbi:hypothetical protein Tco_0954923 [Tanacetum coccineum]|uniref:Uncharacterized protein n=1 Tax=Tanacetum coccineum TaxID=301880 RepID=A0ABQ5E5U9_9ASTR
MYLTIAPDEDKEVDYEILDKKYPIIDWKTECLSTKPHFDESKRLEEINLNVVTRSNGQKRYFSTLMIVLSVFDREDLDAVYKLVMDIYQDKIPEGFDKVILGDLIVMFNPDEQDEFWNSKHEWKGTQLTLLLGEELASPRSTVLGKDYSNLLIADSLLKTIWFINAPCYGNEALASPNTNELSIPEQTATVNKDVAGEREKKVAKLLKGQGCCLKKDREYKIKNKITNVRIHPLALKDR